MTHTIKPLDEGDTGGRRVMRPPHSLEVIRAIEKQEPTPTPPPTEASEPLERRLVLPEDVNGADYVRMGNVLVGKQMIYLGSTWDDAHKALAQDSFLSMLRIDEFMNYLVFMLNTAKGNVTLRNGNGRGIFPTEAQELANYLTQDGVHTWLDALFIHDGSRLCLSTDHVVRGRAIVGTDVEDLEHYASGVRRLGSYVDIAPRNHQGLPMQMAANQDCYVHGENILFLPPTNDFVARFYADNNNYPTLDCRTDPDVLTDDTAGIGVLPCIRLTGETK